MYVNEALIFIFVSIFVLAHKQATTMTARDEIPIDGICFHKHKLRPPHLVNEERLHLSIESSIPLAISSESEFPVTMLSSLTINFKVESRVPPLSFGNFLVAG